MDEQTKAFFEDLRNFPDESERKKTVIKSLDDILRACGSYLNDRETSFSRTEINGKDCLVYKDSYGENVQSIEDDDPKAIFIDALKLLLKNVREFNGSYSELQEFFGDE